MSVDDALQGKEIRVAQDQEGDATAEEYKELSIDVARALKESKQCKHEVIDAVIQGALTLLNHPSAIQQKPTLQPSNTKKYQVASTKAKKQGSRVHGKQELCVLSLPQFQVRLCLQALHCCSRQSGNSGTAHSVHF